MQHQSKGKNYLLQTKGNYTYIFRTIFLVIKYNISAIMSVQRQEICKLFETGFIIYKIMT